MAQQQPNRAATPSSVKAVSQQPVVSLASDEMGLPMPEGAISADASVRVLEKDVPKANRVPSIPDAAIMAEEVGRDGGMHKPVRIHVLKILTGTPTIGDFSWGKTFGPGTFIPGKVFTVPRFVALQLGEQGLAAILE